MKVTNLLDGNEWNNNAEKLHIVDVFNFLIVIWFLMPLLVKNTNNSIERSFFAEDDKGLYGFTAFQMLDFAVFCCEIECELSCWCFHQQRHKKI